MQGSPGNIEAAYSMKGNVSVIANISSFANIAAGMAAADVAKAVSAAAAKAGISKGSHWSWDAAIMNQLKQIEQNAQKQYGVSLWVKIDWQKCEYTESLAPFGPDSGLPGTRHLDWVQQTDTTKVWYQSTLSGANRPEGGFDRDDTQGILDAVPPTIVDAIPALVH